ncbi:MAG: aspartate aminotransferase family protein [Thermoleophilia bacterium]|nr:aspartate aminotransferase family protein [Thermoleophilia bacterium]
MAGAADGGGFAARVARVERYANAPYVRFLRRLGLDLDIVRAEGASVWDASGRRLVDCIAGYGNLNVGHNHPRVVEAVTGELRSGRPFAWPFLGDAASRLAERLAYVTPGELECSLVVSSGSEAVDSALKLVRLATGKPGVVAARGAWHGFTLGALGVSEPGMRDGFGPLLGDVTHVPFGDAAAVEAAIGDATGAVIVEPIQAESGAIVPPDGYLRELVEVCRHREVVLVFDEIKTGIGKTGRLFACEHEDAAPDLLLVGKSLGGGAMPIGAVVARRRLWGRLGLSVPMSASSAAGNAPACAAALATLDVVETERLCERAERAGTRVMAALGELGRRYPSVVTGASGRGLLLALHTPSPLAAAAIVTACARRDVLVMTAFCDRTRILIEPPLSLSDEELELVLAGVAGAVAETAARPGEGTTGHV